MKGCAHTVPSITMAISWSGIPLVADASRSLSAGCQRDVDLRLIAAVARDRGGGYITIA
jgi:hypothetical protein